MKSHHKSQLADTRQAGLTLVELIVAISISSLLLIGIMTFMITSLNNNHAGRARADLLRQAQTTLDTMTKDIRLSSGVTEYNLIDDSNSPDAETTNNRGWVSNEGTLVLLKTAEDANRNILFEDANRYVTKKDNLVYFVANKTLYKRVLSNEDSNNRSTTTCPVESQTADCPPDIKLVENVTDFRIRYFDNMDEEVGPDQARSIEASLTLSTKKGGSQIDANYTTRTVFRNE